MKSADLEWMQVGRWWYLLVHTEEGITGLGEAGIHGYPEAVGGIMDAWKPPARKEIRTPLHEDGSVADA